jgi:hypothetical protein
VAACCERALAARRGMLAAEDAEKRRKAILAADLEAA